MLPLSMCHYEGTGDVWGTTSEGTQELTAISTLQDHFSLQELKSNASWKTAIFNNFCTDLGYRVTSNSFFSVTGVVEMPLQQNSTSHPPKMTFQVTNTALKFQTVERLTAQKEYEVEASL